VSLIFSTPTGSPWAHFQTHLEDQIPFDPELHEMTIDTYVENFSDAVLILWQHLLPNVSSVTTHGL
jgi:hypothetical protein